MGKLAKKPPVIYLHRYAIEYESNQFAATRRLLDELIRRKYSPVYFSMRGAYHADAKLRRGIRFLEIPLKVNNKNGFDKWFKTFLYYLFLPSTLLRIKKEKPAFIICKETLPFVPYFVKKLGIPMLIDTSDWWWSILLGSNNCGRKIASFMENLEVKKWNGSNVIAVVHTRIEGKLLEQRGMNKSRISIINAPLFEGVYGPYNARKERKSLGIKPDEFVLAVHGIIHPSKGYDKLLEWWKKITSVHLNWKLLIIGGSIGESWCRNEIKRLNLSKNVIMTGWLPTQKDVNRYLNAADCLLAIRRNTQENIGIMPSALYHSLQTGKPTVAVGLPAIAEIVRNKKDGFLFEPDNYNSFKSVLEEIYTHPKKALQIGRAGLKRAKECFDPDIAAEKYVDIIDRLCSKNR